MKSKNRDIKNKTLKKRILKKRTLKNRKYRGIKNKTFKGGVNIIRKIPEVKQFFTDIINVRLISYQSLYGLVLQVTTRYPLNKYFTNIPYGIDTCIMKLSILANNEIDYIINDTTTGTSYNKRTNTIQDFVKEKMIQEYIYYKTNISEVFREPVCPAVYMLGGMSVKSDDSDASANYVKKKITNDLTILHRVIADPEKHIIDSFIQVIQNITPENMRINNIGLGVLLMENVVNPLTMWDFQYKTTYTPDVKYNKLIQCSYINHWLNYLGIYHNDLHMGNVIFNETTGRIYIIDFGRTNICNVSSIDDFTFNRADIYEKYDRSYHSYLQTGIIGHTIQQKITDSTNTAKLIIGLLTTNGSNLTPEINKQIKIHNTNISKIYNYAWIIPYFRVSTYVVNADTGIKYLELIPDDTVNTVIGALNLPNLYNTESERYVKQLYSKICPAGAGAGVPRVQRGGNVMTLQMDNTLKPQMPTQMPPQKGLEKGMNIDKIKYITVPNMNTSVKKQEKEVSSTSTLTPSKSIQDAMNNSESEKENAKELSLMNERNKEIIKRREQGDVVWLRANLDKYHTSHPDYMYTMYGIMPEPKNINDDIIEF